MSRKQWFASIVAVGLLANVGSSQESKKYQESPSVAHKIDSTSAGIGVRATKLIGMNIQNSQRENVGEIKDIVLDPVTMRIQYVAVTYGGFLGLGNKLFAVPMQAIKMMPNPDNRDNVILVLDVTKEQMNGAQGFDEDHWPNFSDTKFTEDLYRRYRVENRRDRMPLRDGNIDLDVDRGGVKIEVDRKDR